MSDPARTAFLASVDYAHRGLHGGRSGRPENSLPAFAAALEEGFGIECDARLSSDGVPFIFHDRTLDRLTTASGPFAARTASELDTIALSQGPAVIPRLTSVLALVNGRAPLLIELKVDAGTSPFPLCAAVREELRAYRGPVAAMSFHPGVARWFATHAAEIIRGLVVTEQDRPGLIGRIRRHLAMRAARPDFLAYDIRDLPSSFAAHARAGGISVLSWTVRSEQQWLDVRAHADAAIFERNGEGSARG